MDQKWQRLLEPISAATPCGENMSFSPEFDHIQEARREDDPTMDYGEWQSTLKQADWPAVVESCASLLEKRSKDMRLAALLGEGLLKTAGFAGLAQGLEINAELIARFGQDIHPQAEDGDQEQRSGNLSWLVTRAAQLVRQVPLTHASGSLYSLNDYDAARQLQAQLQRNPDTAPDLQDKVTLERFVQAVSGTDKNRYVQWIADVERAQAALKTLAANADALLGDNGPAFSPLAQSLDAVSQRLESIARDIGIGSAANAQAPGLAAPAGQDESVAVVASIPGGPIRSRTQALELLRQVAAYFRQTEPHSPVAYLADKAAHWGSMPLHSWLRSVIKEGGALAHIEELLGLDLEKDGTEE